MDDHGGPEHFHSWAQMYIAPNNSPKERCKKVDENFQPDANSPSLPQRELNKTLPDTLKTSRGPLLTATRMR